MHIFAGCEGNSILMKHTYLTERVRKTDGGVAKFLLMSTFTSVTEETFGEVPLCTEPSNL